MNIIIFFVLEIKLIQYSFPYNRKIQRNILLFYMFKTTHSFIQYIII